MTACCDCFALSYIIINSEANAIDCWYQKVPICPPLLSSHTAAAPPGAAYRYAAYPAFQLLNLERWNLTHTLLTTYPHSSSLSHYTLCLHYIPTKLPEPRGYQECNSHHHSVLISERMFTSSAPLTTYPSLFIPTNTAPPHTPHYSSIHSSSHTYHLTTYPPTHCIPTHSSPHAYHLTTYPPTHYMHTHPPLTTYPQTTTTSPHTHQLTTYPSPHHIPTTSPHTHPITIHLTKDPPLPHHYIPNP